MNFAKSCSRTKLVLLIAGICLFSMSGSANAWWGLHHRHSHHWRHHHHRYSFFAPSYSSFFFAPSYSTFGYYRHYSYFGSYNGCYGRYGAAYPVRYRYDVPTYCPPSYYVTPYVDYGCFGWRDGCDYGYGYGSAGYYSARSVNQSLPPLAYARDESGPLKLETLQQRPSGRIELRINVPQEARVTINGQPTTSTGSERTFVADDVPEGQRYEFVVRAVVDRDGESQTKMKRVTLQGGQISSLAFDLTNQPSAALANAGKTVNTTLRLKVPDEAEVYLAGHEMKQKGAVRLFETSKLLPGEELANYSVRVVFAGDEGLQTREKQLTLVGGQTQEIEFDFEPLQPRLAAN